MDTSPSTDAERALNARDVLQEEFQQLHRTPSQICPNTGAGPRTERDEAQCLRELYAQIHALPRGRSALCLSGGGIRSASFALGILQGLARYGLLRQFDYLSTVSGGGYIGSWLTAWIYRHPEGLRGVCHELADGFPSRSDGGAAEPGPLIHLRDYTNYLSPRSGLSSLDSCTLIATYLRNLLLNWIVLIPMVVSLLLLPQIYNALIQVEVKSQVLRIVTGLLWVTATVTSILWLPSFNQPPSTVGASSREHLRGPRAIMAMAVVPCMGAAMLSCWGWVWRPQPPQIIDSLIISLVTYIAGGAVAAMLFWRRYNSAAYTFRIILLFAVSAVFAVAASALPRLWLRQFASPNTHSLVAYATKLTCFGVPTQLALFILLLTVLVGVESRNPAPAADDDREWWGRLMGAFLRVLVFWLALSLISLILPSYLFSEPSYRWFGNTYWWKYAVILLFLAGGIGLLGGYSESSGDRSGQRDLSAREKLFSVLPSIAARACLLLILVFLAGGVNFVLGRLDSAIDSWVRQSHDAHIDHQQMIAGWQFLARLGLAAANLIFAALAGLVINVNRLSLHAIYRNRLIRAFLGASRFRRKVDPFTNFDPEDNLPIHHLQRPLAFRGSDIRFPIKLSEFFIAKGTSFTASLWQFISDKGSEKLQELLSQVNAQPGRAGAQSRRALRKLLVTYLNELLEVPALLSISSFGKTFPDVMRASRQLTADGRPQLLNRLIIERECSLLQPASATGQRSPLLRRGRPQKPFHVLNLALNLVSTRKLSWQQRKAGSFTVSPLHSGYTPPQHNTPEQPVRGGYRYSSEYGGGITLGTAAAISGAAASPNMGYHSSPAVTFLMMFFNVRLGWWLGNPSDGVDSTGLDVLKSAFRKLPKGGRAGPDLPGNAVWQLPYPKQHLRPFIDEALGQTTDLSQYVYLSDGGHFENLGLYEMVRRRCRTIVVVDATCDLKHTFADLGNSIRNIRVDLGVPVFINRVDLLPGLTNSSDRYCAVGTIDYPAADGEGAKTGTILYFKAALTSTVPVDVYNYSKTSATFPNESTAEQWFTDAQFESYRRLGEECIVDICSGVKNMPRSKTEPGKLRLNDLVRLAKKHVEQGPSGRRSYDPRSEESSDFHLDKTKRSGRGSFTRESMSGVPDRSGVYCLFDESHNLILVATALSHPFTLRRELERCLKEGVFWDARFFSVSLCQDPLKREAEILRDYKKAHGGILPKYNRAAMPQDPTVA